MFDKIRFTMSDKEARRWERIRARGSTSVILWRGMLGFGGLAFALSTCSAVLISHRHLDAALVAQKALTWLLAGLFFGLCWWLIEESRYRAFGQVSSSHLNPPL